MHCGTESVQTTTQLSVKVEVSVYKGALKARLAQLKIEHAEHAIKCERLFEAWKLALSEWLATDSPAIVRDMTLRQFTLKRHWNDRDSEQIDGDKLLATAPRLTLPRSDAACLIERVEALLAQLAMTSQKAVIVTTKAIEGLGLASDGLK